MNLQKRILVVDDEPDFASIVQGNLEKEGFTVDVAYNGVEGLEKVQANPPDAIVLDVMMPEKDGYVVCQELKEDDKYCNIPIILLTAVLTWTSSRYWGAYRCWVPTTRDSPFSVARSDDSSRERMPTGSTAPGFSTRTRARSTRGFSMQIPAISSAILSTRKNSELSTRAITLLVMDR